MKQRLLTIMFAMLCFALQASAHDFEVDGIYYNITDGTAMTVEVSYRGSSYPEYANEYSGSVVIPGSVTYNGSTYGVTTIGSQAFYNCSALTCVTIPESVTTIGSEAFRGCSGLTSVTIPESVTTIGYQAFNGCSALKELTLEDCESAIAINNGSTSSFYVFSNCPIETLYLGRDCSGTLLDSNKKTSLKSLTIGNSVTTIGSSAFRDCSGLTSVTIPGSVTTIGSVAFYGCSALTSVIIGNGVTTIGSYAFNGCSRLTSVTIPESVTTIGGGAFSGCSGLTSVTIPESVTTIGSHAFYNCSALTCVTIPESVTTIGESAFSGCSALKELTLEDGESAIAINNGNTSSSYVFSNCPIETLYLGRDCSGTLLDSNKKTSLKSLTIGNSVTTIAGFSGCTGLTSVTIPENVTTIGSYAFNGCSGLTSVIIGNGVTTIGSYAFHGCSGLTSVTIPESVTEIDSEAFRYCSALTSVTIGNSVTTIGSYAFSGCSGLEKVEINCATVGNWFSGNTSIKEIILGNGVTTIGSSAFSGCSALTSITIPESVTTIGRSAFSGCSALKELTLEDGESAIAINNESYFYVFNDCPIETLYLGRDCSGTLLDSNKKTSLKSLTIGNSVTTIGESAFHGCSGLTSVTIPESVTTIGESAFSGCSRLEDITLEGTVPAAVSANSFYSNTQLYVPTEAYQSYIKADGWKSLINNITTVDYYKRDVAAAAQEGNSSVLAAIGEDITTAVVELKVSGTINSYDIIIIRDKMPALRYLDLSEASVVASSKPFYGSYCTGDNSLGSYTFYEKTNLRSVKLPAELDAIGSYMFDGCTSLESVEIPETVTSIGSYAFRNCGALTSIAIPNSVTSIGDNAFYSCDNLESVTMGNSVKSIGYYAFGHCNKLKDIKLPPTLETIGGAAFYSCSSLAEIRIPSSVKSIGSGAFSYCRALQKVYTYTIEPTTIAESTFSTFATATLYIPSTSRYNYYWDDGWKRFLTHEDFDEPYEYFYLNNDYTLDDVTGSIDGTPDADLNAGSGLIVEGETVNQELGDVNMNHNGSISSSIIGDDNIHAEKLNIRISVTGSRWYFFSFPCDIKFSDISMSNGCDYVFRYYDGKERANNGKGGWKNASGYIKAHQGYIFQAAETGVLVLAVNDIRFKKENKNNELNAYPCDNASNASWNFVGNPYFSYYDMADMGYDAPITIWNGTGYEAIRPGDDDHQFAPFEAFFVQKPDGVDNVEYDGDKRTTHKGASDKAAAARRRAAARNVNPERLLVNLTISDGENSDRTRVVFNEKQSLGYEISCDAAKFNNNGAVEIYTINGDVRYAINERPKANGVVLMGYTAVNSGFCTIEAVRMDTPVVLYDAETSTLHDLSTGAYTFSTDAGTFENRFTMGLGNEETTGVEGIESSEAVEAVEGGIVVSCGAVVYNAAGVKVAEQNGAGTIELPAGTYVVSSNGKNTKVVVK